MTYADSILPEFDMEMANTRKVLERIPDDRLDWQPHPKSHTIGWNANHVADLLNWLLQILKTPSLDIAPVGGPPYILPQLATRQEILELFDWNVAAAQSHQRGHGPGRGQRVDVVTRGHADFHHAAPAVIRGFVLNHLIHHRAHLCVYLRLNDIPVPGMYGPSGDE